MAIIPNTLTAANLFCGILAIIFVIQGDLQGAAIAVGASLVFDFLDGMVARALKVSSDVGKELDSLADVVSFGVVPGLIMARLIAESQGSAFPPEQSWTFGLYLVGVLVSVFSALRLAKFNLDTRQSDAFIGLPTPANTLLIYSYWMILVWSPDSQMAGVLGTTWLLVLLALLSSYLLIAELPLIALKFKSLAWKPNRYRYILIGLSVILIVAFQYMAIPFVILLYILLSLLDNAGRRATPQE